MPKLKGSGNASTELRLVAVFRALGVTGWRRKANVLGKPDFVFPKLRGSPFSSTAAFGTAVRSTPPSPSRTRNSGGKR
jgi:DNA mismatch endonuclease (patch repair protein)